MNSFQAFALPARLASQTRAEIFSPRGVNWANALAATSAVASLHPFGTQTTSIASNSAGGCSRQLWAIIERIVSAMAAASFHARMPMLILIKLLGAWAVSQRFLAGLRPP